MKLRRYKRMTYASEASRSGVLRYARYDFDRVLRQLTHVVQGRFPRYADYETMEYVPTAASCLGMYSDEIIPGPHLDPTLVTNVAEFVEVFGDEAPTI